ncbi:MAG: hypothetical protein FJ298_06740 [Planctomycetes bacterium]|nr:hypothetical protein [Planctomycetota bacterium]
MLLVTGLALLALLAFVLRAQPATGDARARGGVYAPLADSDSDYRMRLVELSLVTSHVPERDRFLGPDAATALPPWPPLVHAALAVGFAHTLERSEQAVELGGIEETTLERARAWIAPASGALVVLAAGMLCLYLAGADSGAAVALVVAAFAALHPLGIARESAPSLNAHGWIVLCSLAQFAGLALALRGAERVDLLVGALGAGVGAALALLAGPEAWPVCAAVLGAFVVRALRASREHSREQWRAVLAYLATGLALLALVREDRAPTLWLPDVATLGLLDCSLDTLALSLAAAALALALVRRRWREPLVAAFALALALSLVGALVDRRFFAAFVAANLALAALALERVELARGRGLALALAALAALVVPTLVRAREASASADSLPAALRWLRERSSSPGAFNHPEAEQAWRVAAPPALAGAIGLHARRGVVGASFEGARAPLSPALAAVFEAREPLQLAAAMARADAAYLLVTPLVLRDAELALHPHSVVARLALDPQLELHGALEPVYVSPRWITAAGAAAQQAEGGGPAVAIYRRLGVRGVEDAPSLSPRER